MNKAFDLFCQTHTWVQSALVVALLVVSSNIATLERARNARADSENSFEKY